MTEQQASTIKNDGLDFTYVDNLDELTQELDIDPIHAQTGQPLNLFILKGAIAKGRIGLTSDQRVRVELSEPVQTRDKRESSVVCVRRAEGEERKICANESDNRQGDASQRCISNMTGIRLAAIDRMRSKDVALLEEIVSLFL